MALAPVIALSHGGGPMPLLGDPDHKSIVHSLQHRVPEILSLNTSPPKAIILITAHWSTSIPTISSAPRPGLLYDYYGFPPEAYEIEYPAKGHPGIADQVAQAMRTEGLDVKLDPQREWDHGVFVPMTLIRPQADIPIIQISVLKSEDAGQHIRMGRALHSLRAQNIAIVGSGFASFHNIRLMLGMRSSPPSQQKSIKSRSENFSTGVWELLKKGGDAITNWRRVPGADDMHPPRGGEHFMPLVVCAGAAGEGEEVKMYKDQYVGVDIWTWYWSGKTLDAKDEL